MKLHSTPVKTRWTFPLYANISRDLAGSGVGGGGPLSTSRSLFVRRRTAVVRLQAGQVKKRDMSVVARPTVGSQAKVQQCHGCFMVVYTATVVV